MANGDSSLVINTPVEDSSLYFTEPLKSFLFEEIQKILHSRMTKTFNETLVPISETYVTSHKSHLHHLLVVLDYYNYLWRKRAKSVLGNVCNGHQLCNCSS